MIVPTITKSPSTIGEAVRPPWVVHEPNSSVSERLHSTLPSFDNAVSSLHAPKTYMLPVAGSPTGDDQAMRRGGTSLSYMFRRCSHNSFPVSAFRHITRSCIDSPSPDVLNRKMRPPITIGVERPPYGAFQTRFSPFGDQ